MNTRLTTSLTLSVRVEAFPLKHPFHITGYTFTSCDAVVVTLERNGCTGRGEGLGVYYLKDTPTRMVQQIEALRPQLEAGPSREELLRLLPAGGARNAVDCAFWELEAREQGQPVWALAGLSPPPNSMVTTLTLSADAPEVVARQASAYVGAQALKLKLSNDAWNAERLRAVRSVHPAAWLMVDANQGLTRDSFQALLPAMLEAGVELVEQPFPVGSEHWFDNLGSPIPLAADESVQDRTDLAALVDRVQVINIKLDKCGGLTEALMMEREARNLGFKTMVGNMGGSSLSIAPACLLGTLCSVADLDGPLFIKQDRLPAATYEDGRIFCHDTVWGGR
ncbi:dipeptide epimerase [Frateuria aurantia]